MAIVTEEECFESMLAVNSNGAPKSFIGNSWLSVAKSLKSISIGAPSAHGSTWELASQQIEIFAPEYKREKDYQRNRVMVNRPDQGYAWVILISCGIILTIPAIPMASTGILYTQLLESLDYGEEKMSWICSLQPALAMMSGPLAAFLMDKTSARTTVLIGSLGAGISMAIASFTNDFTTLLLTYGILTGVFLCCMFVPATVYPAYFFKRYRVMALVATTLGVPIAFVAIPPTLTLVLEQYDWRIGLRFLAAISLQGCVFAMLLRPIRKKNQETLPESSANINQHSAVIDNSNVLVKYKNIDEQKDVFGHQITEQRAPSQNEEDKESHRFDNKTLESNSNIEDTLDDGKLNTLYEDVENVEVANGCRRPDIFHWRVGILLISNFMWGAAASLFFVLLPEQAKLSGLAHNTASYLIIIAGLVNFVMRIVSVIVGHFANMQKIIMLIIGHAFLALCLLVLCFSSEFMHFAIAVTCYGIGYACHTCFSCPAIIEMHGDTEMEMITGVELLIYGIAATVASPFTALIYTIGGSYTPGFLVGSILNGFGAFIFLPHVLMKWRSRVTDVDTVDGP